ncbi:MAG: dicarboxylate/amino acid:cation symporter, partial [Gemmatimonadetes bacterium]
MKLHTKIVLGLVLGAAGGVAANTLAPGAAWVRWTGDNVAGPVGQVFLRMLLMTVIPLVFTSITLGVAGIGDIRKVGRVGIRTIVYF